MTTNMYGFIKAAGDTSLSSLAMSAAPALFGALGGGGLGYLTGQDADARGEGGTRWRNALIGAGLGGLGAGAASNYFASDLVDAFPDLKNNPGMAGTLGGIGGIGSVLLPTAGYGALLGSLASLGLTEDKQKNGFNNAIAGALAGLGLGSLGAYGTGLGLTHKAILGGGNQPAANQQNKKRQ